MDDNAGGIPRNRSATTGNTNGNAKQNKKPLKMLPANNTNRHNALRDAGFGANAFEAWRIIMIGLSKKMAIDRAIPTAAIVFLASGKCAKVVVCNGSPQAMVTSLRDKGRNSRQRSKIVMDLELILVKDFMPGNCAVMRLS